MLENSLTESAYKSCCLLEEDQIKTFNTILTVLEPAAARYRAETGQTSTADLLAKYDKDVFEHMIARAKILTNNGNLFVIFVGIEVTMVPIIRHMSGTSFLLYGIELLHRCRNGILENTKYCRLCRNKLHLNSNKNTETSFQISSYV